MLPSPHHWLSKLAGTNSFLSGRQRKLSNHHGQTRKLLLRMTVRSVKQSANRNREVCQPGLDAILLKHCSGPPVMPHCLTMHKDKHEIVETSFHSPMNVLAPRGYFPWSRDKSSASHRCCTLSHQFTKTGKMLMTIVCDFLFSHILISFQRDRREPRWP